MCADAAARWHRPVARELDPKTQALTLQQMDTDYYVQAPRGDMPAFAQKLGTKYETYGGQVCARACVRVCVCACMCVCIYVHTHTSPHRSTR